MLLFLTTLAYFEKGYKYLRASPFNFRPYLELKRAKILGDTFSIKKIGCEVKFCKKVYVKRLIV